MSKNNRLLFVLFAGWMVSIISPALGQVNRQEIKVVEMAVCRSVRDHQPVGVDSTFDSQIGSLCCFTKIEGAAKPTVVRHIWYHGEKKTEETSLPVKALRWRTHSRRSILPSQTGRWNVVILSEDGDPLGHISFTITP